MNKDMRYYKTKKKEFKTYLGRNLKNWRKKNNYSLDDIALNTGLSKSYLSQLETGQSLRPSVETAYILWRTLEIEEPFDLFIFNPSNLTPK